MKKSTLLFLFYFLFFTSTALLSQVKKNIASIAKPVDLGLSIKWATWNIGARCPEDIGDEFAWGETVTKKDYSLKTYKFFDIATKKYTKYYHNYDANSQTYITDYEKHTVIDGASTYGERKENTDYGAIKDVGDIKAVILDNCDDVATVRWGEMWRMPTNVELKELYSKCKWEFVTLNNIKGYKITGPNGNSIFIPGDEEGHGAIYSSASPMNESKYAYKLSFNRYNPIYDSSDRYWEASVRPVTK